MNAHDRPGVVIVGAGQSGGRLAQRLRLRRYSGRITLVGEEAHPPYERPPLSKAFLSGRAPLALLCEPAWYAENDITLRSGERVAGIDRAAQNVFLKDGTRIPYETLVLAVGARPRVLTVPGANLPGVFTLRTVGDAERLRQHLSSGQVVAIVGAGLIGLEIASTTLELGCRPLLIEAAERPLGRVMPKEVSALFAELLETRAVSSHYSARVSAITGADGKLLLQLADGRGFPCDAVVVAIGVEPNCELAAQAGLDVGNGIITDEVGRTSDPRIFAIGDAAFVSRADGGGTRLETWHNAEMQAGRVAALIAEGQAPALNQAPWFWTDQFGLQAQFAGTTEGVEAVLCRRGDSLARSVALYLTRGVVVGGATFAHPQAMRTIRRWLTPGSPDVPRAEAATFLASLAS